MRIAEENWKVLGSLFPAGWQQMAWQSGAVERLRGFPSPDVLLRVLLLHVARGYSLRETVVRAKLANWADISDVALLKRLRNIEEWLHFFEPPKDYRDQYEELTGISLRLCPVCRRGQMIRIAVPPTPACASPTLRDTS